MPSSNLNEVFVDILRLAELEKTAEMLAEEIEKTRRRVSALENIRIPNLQDTVKFITMQLDERNRDAVVSTMRVKAMILAKEAENSLDWRICTGFARCARHRTLQYGFSHIVLQPAHLHPV